MNATGTCIGKCACVGRAVSRVEVYAQIFWRRPVDGNVVVAIGRNRKLVDPGGAIAAGVVIGPAVEEHQGQLAGRRNGKRRSRASRAGAGLRSDGSNSHFVNRRQAQRYAGKEGRFHATECQRPKNATGRK